MQAGLSWFQRFCEDSGVALANLWENATVNCRLVLLELT